MKAEQILGSDRLIDIFPPVEYNVFLWVDYLFVEHMGYQPHDKLQVDDRTMIIRRDNTALVLFTRSTLSQSTLLNDFIAFWPSAQESVR